MLVNPAAAVNFASLFPPVGRRSVSDARRHNSCLIGFHLLQATDVHTHFFPPPFLRETQIQTLNHFNKNPILASLLFFCNPPLITNSKTSFICSGQVRLLISFEGVGIHKQPGDLSDSVQASKEERTTSPSRDISALSRLLLIQIFPILSMTKAHITL